MNLDKIKELEDLKIELSSLGKQEDKKFINKKSMYLLGVQSEFKEFFKEKGFSINETSHTLEANYNSAKITMEKAGLNDDYMGCYSAWDIDCLISNSKYRVMLKDLSKYQDYNTNINSYKQLSEDEKIQVEINETKEAIEMLKHRIESYDSIKWSFMLSKEGQSYRECELSPCESYRQVLEYLFK